MDKVLLESVICFGEKFDMILPDSLLFSLFQTFNIFNMLSKIRFK